MSQLKSDKQQEKEEVESSDENQNDKDQQNEIESSEETNSKSSGEKNDSSNSLFEFDIVLDEIQIVSSASSSVKGR